MSYAAYVAAEASSPVRHEYLRGEVYAMAGGTPEHAALIAAMTTELSVALRGRPCRVYSADLRVRVTSTDLSTYPDVSVVCGVLETAADDAVAVTNPLTGETTHHGVGPSKVASVPIPPLPPGSVLHITVGWGARTRTVTVEIVAPAS